MDHLGIPTQTYKWPKFLRLGRERSCWESQLETRQIIYRLNKRKKIIVNWASTFFVSIKKECCGVWVRKSALGGVGGYKECANSPKMFLRRVWQDWGCTHVPQSTGWLPICHTQTPSKVNSHEIWDFKVQVLHCFVRRHPATLIPIRTWVLWGLKMPLMVRISFFHKFWL